MSERIVKRAAALSEVPAPAAPAAVAAAAAAAPVVAVWSGAPVTGFALRVDGLVRPFTTEAARALFAAHGVPLTFWLNKLRSTAVVAVRLR